MFVGLLSASKLIGRGFDGRGTKSTNRRSYAVTRDEFEIWNILMVDMFQSTFDRNA